MKALRYLLIVMMLSVASMVFATAQSFAQEPKAQMTSTSGMVYSGSSLPQAATTGAYVTGSTVGSYSPASSTTGGPHRAKRGLDDDDDDIPTPGDNEDPDKTPLGDAGIPLLMLAAAYALLRVYKRKRSV